MVGSLLLKHPPPILALPPYESTTIFLPVVPLSPNGPPIMNEPLVFINILVIFLCYIVIKGKQCGTVFMKEATRMNKMYLGIIAALQIFVGVLASIYLIKIMLGASITMSLWIAIPAAVLGLILGVGNIIKLKS